MGHFEIIWFAIVVLIARVYLSIRECNAVRMSKGHVQAPVQFVG